MVTTLIHAHCGQTRRAGSVVAVVLVREMDGLCVDLGAFEEMWQHSRQSAARHSVVFLSSFAVECLVVYLAPDFSQISVRPT